jgi:methionyl-tRNA synthetase
MSKFYLTTTTPYVNADPHIGFALEIVQADALARLHRLAGDEIFFNTGTDEHGQKIYQKALEAGKDPKVYCDEYAAKFDNLKSSLNLSYTNFIRTTDPHHKKAAQEFWKLCAAKGDIYKANYQVKYCVGCELEKTDSELVDGKCPVHPNLKLEMREEENYFFRWSGYQSKLLGFYNQNPEFILPDFRFNELKQFVSGGLQDFSISRLKEKMPWGIAVPDDPDHVMYVWFDALVNYISATGWPEDKKSFNAWWPGIQVAGKDNLRQQAAMWQAMLMSAGLPNTKQIMIHGFITSGGQKMSKSLGNVVSPYELVNKYGTDVTRYYLLAKINPFEDGDFTFSKFEEAYTSDLANGLGNLVQRVAKLCELKNLVFSPNLSNSPKFPNFPNFSSRLQRFEFNLALEELWQNFSALDAKINVDKPWEKSNKEAGKDLKVYVEKILELTPPLSMFLPETAFKIQQIFKGPKISAPSVPLFPRLPTSP